VGGPHTIRHAPFYTTLKITKVQSFSNLTYRLNFKVNSYFNQNFNYNLKKEHSFEILNLTSGSVMKIED
jgi:hypothetical protein